MLAPLPIDAHVEAVRAALGAARAAVLVAPPGSGKTTRVPPALVAEGAVFLLQPRRVAARSIARRIADEQGWTLGEQVGWQVRFERRYGPKTRLLVATEGVLTRRLQSDPLLGGFDTIVLDEFHERSIHADLAIALARQAWRARHDLRLLVMSATLDAGPVARFLDGCPVVSVTGRPHPIEVVYEPGRALAEAARTVAARASGHVLCFLPGAPEIRRAQSVLDGSVPGWVVLPLHGTLRAEEQDRAIAPSPERKLILATNVAETSLTVEGVTDVIDTGLHKVLRYDAARALDRLELERIPADSAEQRAGRAGRTGPGRVLRLWDPRDRLRPQREPEIERVDLAGPALEVLAWGGDPTTFEWFEAAARRSTAGGAAPAGATRGARRPPADGCRSGDAPAGTASAARSRLPGSGGWPARCGGGSGPGRGLAARVPGRCAHDRLGRADRRRPDPRGAARRACRRERTAGGRTPARASARPG